MKYSNFYSLVRTKTDGGVLKKRGEKYPRGIDCNTKSGEILCYQFCNKEVNNFNDKKKNFTVLSLQSKSTSRLLTWSFIVVTSLVM